MHLLSTKHQSVTRAHAHPLARLLVHFVGCVSLSLAPFIVSKFLSPRDSRNVLSISALRACIRARSLSPVSACRYAIVPYAHTERSVFCFSHYCFMMMLIPLLAVTARYLAFSFRLFHSLIRSLDRTFGATHTHTHMHVSLSR